ncbi:membrane protein insertase YidC [Verrucosispora sp. WMMD573]|uniref:membrane protein insertase YidC n=1 Tax=Verrucosispora sp. WMMD573 TaxID=3015149 RepID=UPI00248C6757|nr:membrane protein insertase YidC [Verrucosispora sp. WMMD573]WBB52609.1 membrane protein insertase YidC [Verrucosispora sp. WMMD573]
MSMIYRAISEILLFWHTTWQRLLGDASGLGTDWSWVLGIVFLVLTVRIILFPVFVKQIRSQRAVQALQPRIAELQARHRDDRETLQKELVELYRVEKANPLMGCLPMVVQIPVFLGLLHVLRHLKPSMPEHLKTLYGWSVTQFDSASSATLFGAPIAGTFGSTGQELALLGADGTTVRIVAAVLIATMIATTYLSSRQLILRSGWATGPQQRLVQRLMLYGIPASLLVSGLIFPIGVIIYWVTTNLFSLGQQTWTLRRYPLPASSATSPGPRGDASKAVAGGDDDEPGRPAAPKVGAKPTNHRRRRAT